MTETEASMMTMEEKVHDLVSYHKPDEQGVERITHVREATERLIKTIVANYPAGADRSAAIRSARLAMMQANAAIVVPAHNIEREPMHAAPGAFR